MIRGMHGMFYTSEPDALRAFFRDQLRFPFNDVGEGWLIFDLPEADLGMHPTHPGGPASGTHDISFYCDDIEKTVAELKTRGVVFTEGISDRGFGLVTHFSAPGNIVIQLYQPHYAKASKPRPVMKAKARRPAAKSARAAKKAKPAAKAKGKAKKAPAKKRGRR
jgi:predicted enzyme related to lactoylglutathione lyase